MRKKVVTLQRKPLTTPEINEQFISYKQAQGLSITTIKDYRGHIKRFFNRYPDFFINVFGK